MKLRDWMDGRKLSQPALAAKLGVTQATVSRYASGDLTPSLAVIQRLDELSDGEVSFVDFLPDRPVAEGSR